MNVTVNRALHRLFAMLGMLALLAMLAYQDAQRDYATVDRIGDRMVSGFALIAWPVSYGQSGVMSFIVNHDGVIHERNLGLSDAKIAASIQRFNPDSRWRRTQP